MGTKFVKYNNLFIQSRNLCLFVCIYPIRTHEPQTEIASNFNWGTRENHGNRLNLVLSLQGSCAKITLYFEHYIGILLNVL